MMRLVTLALLLAASVASAAPVPKEIRKAGKLDGLWEITSMEVFGKPGAILPQQHCWKIENGTITVVQAVPNAANFRRAPIAIKVDGSATPKSLDYNTGGATPRPAIYEVDGDTLKILMNLRGNERPKEMKSDDSTVLYVFKRVKE